MPANKQAEAMLLFKSFAKTELRTGKGTVGLNADRNYPILILVAAMEKAFEPQQLGKPVARDRIEQALAVRGSRNDQKYRETIEINPNRHTAVCYCLLRYLHGGTEAFCASFEDILKDTRYSPLENEKLVKRYTGACNIKLRPLSLL